MKVRSLKNIENNLQEIANIKRVFIEYKLNGYKPLSKHKIDQVIAQMLFISKNGKVKFNNRREGRFIKEDLLFKSRRGPDYIIICGQVPIRGYICLKLK